MNSQRPYFPQDVLEVPAVNYAKITDDVCDWNLKFSGDGCNGTELVDVSIYAKVEWNTVRYEVKKEEFQNGLGDIESDLTRVDRIYSFVTWADEFCLWYIYQVIYGFKRVIFSKNEEFPESLTSYDANIEAEELEKGCYKITISFKTRTNDSLRYHDAFGLTGCCDALYQEDPYEGCEENGGDIDNYEPPCDDVTFSISEDGGTLTANVAGTPSTFSVSWYFRLNAQAAWSLLISGASSVSIGGYGIYRAVLTAAGCGQYIDQYLNIDPCTRFDVKIRRAVGNGVVAEIPSGFAGVTYEWEYNDGEGWVTLPDTTSAIVALATGDYRVTATKGECEDMDVFYVLVNEVDDCDFEATIYKEGASLTALTTAASPSYLWTREDETGQTTISTNVNANLTITGIYWLTVTSGGCIKRTYIFYKAPDDCLKVEICNIEDLNLTPNITVNACCEDSECDATITINCVNKVLVVSGMPGGATIGWIGPDGYVASGNGAAIELEGEYTATIIDGDCIWTSTYEFIMPDAGTPVEPIILTD